MLARLRTILQRGFLPIVMVALGVASLLWGAARHTLEVYEEQEIEISIAPPPEMMQSMAPPAFPTGPEQGMGQGFLGDPAFGDPAFGAPPDMGGMPPFIAGPPPELQKVKQIVMISKEEPESRVVFEVTIGGLALLETGELKRTYSGAPPSLCPT